MSKGMRADFFFQTDAFGELFDDVKNHDSGYVIPFSTDENEIFISGFNLHRISVDEV